MLFNTYILFNCQFNHSFIDYYIFAIMLTIMLHIDGIKKIHQFHCNHVYFYFADYMKHFIDYHIYFLFRTN